MGVDGFHARVVLREGGREGGRSNERWCKQFPGDITRAREQAADQILFQARPPSLPPLPPSFTYRVSKEIRHTVLPLGIKLKLEPVCARVRVKGKESPARAVAEHPHAIRGGGAGGRGEGREGDTGEW